MMTRRWAQRVCLGVFGLILVSVYARYLHTSTAIARTHGVAPTLQPTPVETPEAPEVVAEEGRMLSAFRAAQRQHAATLTWQRDPFTSGTEVTLGLTLTGIIWDPTQPLAMINGATLSVGEEIDGFRVLQIQHDRVILTDQTQTYTLRLTP